MVYLPEGNNWFDYWTGEEYAGGQYIIKNAPLDTCPIFIREGAIIPTYPEMNYIGEKEIDKLELNIFVSDENEFVTEYHHYVDDGESFEYKDGIYDEYKVKVTNSQTITIDFDKVQSKYMDKYKEVEIFVHSLYGRDVVVNGEGNIIIRDDK